MVTRKEIIKVIESIGTPLNDDAIKDNHHLYNDLLFDSLDIIALGIELENEFLIEVPEEKAEEWKKVEDVINTIIK